MLFMNFRAEKAFDIRAVARAAPQQVDFVQGALVAPRVLDRDRCFISPAIYYQHEGHEAWFFGARLGDGGGQKQSGSPAPASWFICLLRGPKDAPV